MNSEFEKEMSFSDILKKTKEIFLFVWKFKIWIFLVSILGSLIGFLYANTSKPIYDSTITFMVKDDGSTSSIGGVASILGSLGFGGSKGKFNLDKVVALTNSQNIIRKALLDSVPNGISKSLLADVIIEKYKLKDNWSKRKDIISSFDGFRNIDNMTPVENSAINNLYVLIAGSENKNKILKTTYDEDNTIFTLSVSSISDSLSYYLSMAIFNHLQDFYIYQSTQKALITVKSLEAKVEAVEKKLNKKDYSLAVSKDESEGLWREKDKITQVQTNRDIQINSIMYGELLKNLETAKFSLQTATPIFQVIDEPFFPLNMKFKSRLKYTLLGFVLLNTIFIAGLFLIFYYRESINKNL